MTRSPPVEVRERKEQQEEETSEVVGVLGGGHSEVVQTQRALNARLLSRNDLTQNTQENQSLKVQVYAEAEWGMQRSGLFFWKSLWLWQRRPGGSDSIPSSERRGWRGTMSKAHMLGLGDPMGRAGRSESERGLRSWDLSPLSTSSPS